MPCFWPRPRINCCTPEKEKAVEGVSAADIARMEREMASVELDIKQIWETYGDNELVLTVSRNYPSQASGQCADRAVSFPCITEKSWPSLKRSLPPSAWKGWHEGKDTGIPRRSGTVGRNSPIERNVSARIFFSVQFFLFPPCRRSRRCAVMPPDAGAGVCPIA